MLIIFDNKEIKMTSNVFNCYAWVDFSFEVSENIAKHKMTKAAIFAVTLKYNKVSETCGRIRNEGT